MNWSHLGQRHYLGGASYAVRGGRHPQRVLVVVFEDTLDATMGA